jgi:Fe-S-cluster containining protein
MDIYYVLYSDGACPFYDKGCKVHDDFRRPKLCKQYPYIGIQGGDSVLVSESCSAFRKKEVRDIFFRKYGFKIVSASSTCD